MTSPTDAVTGLKAVDPWVRLPTVLSVSSLGKTTFYELIKEGKAPAPTKVGRASLWRQSDIAKWLDHLGGQS